MIYEITSFISFMIIMIKFVAFIIKIKIVMLGAKGLAVR